MAINGAWRSSTPISPAAPGTITISASSSKTAPSGVVTESENVWRPSATYLRRNCFGLFRRLRFGFRGRLLGLLLLIATRLTALRRRVVDRADHVEGLLGQVV